MLLLTAVHFPAGHTLSVLHLDTADAHIHEGHNHDHHQSEQQHRQQGRHGGQRGSADGVGDQAGEAIEQVGDDTAKISRETPFPRPFAVIRSPIHMASAVPAAMLTPTMHSVEPPLLM